MLVALALTACGGGGGAGDSTASVATTGTAVASIGTAATTPADAASADSADHADALASRSTSRIAGGVASSGTTQTDAARLLTQGTFGPTLADIQYVASLGAKVWVTEQLALPYTASRGIQAHVKAQAAAGVAPYQDVVLDGFWKQAVTTPDQLRARVAFALSQIFVVSFLGDLDDNTDLVSSYYDMLSANAFGDYRTLLEAVTRHPAMGKYLSHMRNLKEDTSTGRLPNENYAREMLQLFSIGIYQLNADGSNKLDANGATIPAFTSADVQGLARVFTGWSWAGADKTDQRFWNNPPTRDDIAYSTPMQGYPQYHSNAEKKFLGKTVAAQSTANPEASLKVALDAVAAHSNVGPFISKLLIQRLVTSNPTPGYVGRVAAVFNDNGAGKRGDLGAVVSAILLDSEARSTDVAATAGYGKLREPILRATAWMRAFGVTSLSGAYTVGITDSSSASLNQSPLRSPSVFNFFRPTYVVPGSSMAARGLVAPEMQINTTTSVAGYVNAMYYWVLYGAGKQGAAGKFDLQPDYTSQISMAGDPDKLLDHLNTLLFTGRLSATLRQQLKDVMNDIPLDGTAASIADKSRARVCLALLMSLTSPDFIIQK